MTALVALLLVSIFTLDYLAFKLELVSPYVTLVPEVCTLLITLVIIGRSIVLRRWEQPVHYLWIIVALILVWMIGAVAEAVDPGPLVSGLRNYFKFLPLILLPAVYRFSDRQLRILLGIFLMIAALQVPLAFFQRFVQFSDRMHTGDPITGTVSTSSSLTLVLCLAITLVMTLYVHRKIALSVALVLFCYLAAPTAINETKATLLLLPIAALGPFFLARGVEGKWRKAAPVLGICALGMVAFAAVYNILIEARWQGVAIDEFFTSGYWEFYLYRGVEAESAPAHIGRLDSIILPISYLSNQWMQLLFGFGIGNVSPAFLPGMEGAYFWTYQGYGFGMTAIGDLLWETGVVGLSLYLLLFVFIWRDSRRYAITDEDARWYGTWWSICIVIFAFGLTYKSILNFNELGYMLFFWSGIIASRSWQLRYLADSTAISQATPRLQLAGRKS